MAGALVGGAFLSGFINVVFDRLLSPEAANLIIGKKLDRVLVERLKTALCAAEALLVDAERKQMDNQLVKNWLDSLRDAVYKADDLLDHVFTKAATEKEVRTFMPRFLNFQDREMVNKIEGVVRRIEDLEKRRYILGLEKISTGNSSWRTPSTSLVKGNIYGRENDLKAVIEIIKNNSEHQLCVIPIVGMGGVGKTTLAQWVYSNEDLMKGFDLKAWVCISDKFDIVEITKTIIRGIISSTYNLEDFNLLQLDLKEKLSKKKFFIVMDDVWSDDGHCWNNFKTPFQYGAKGSTILITIRTKEVASLVKTCPPYFLNELSEDNCWSVFANNACFPESNGNSTMEEIGKKIVKKCKGLPLAAETLGCLLRAKHDVKEWDNVLKSDIWEFPMKESELIHLRLLDLSMTSIKALPKSLCDLYNLQTLKLFNCYMLTMLPNGMHNLVNLRHLDIRETSLKEMPRGMGKLKHLHFLSYFVVGRYKDSGIKELEELSNLHGTLEISKLENVANSGEVMGARIMDKMHIDNLYLKWSSGGDMVPSTQTERDILDKLQTHNGLKELTVQGTGVQYFQIG